MADMTYYYIKIIIQFYGIVKEYLQSESNKRNLHEDTGELVIFSIICIYSLIFFRFTEYSIANFLAIILWVLFIPYFIYSIIHSFFESVRAFAKWIFNKKDKK